MIFPQRRRPESNRCDGFCRPAPNHSATSPVPDDYDLGPSSERKTGFEPATSTLARLRSSQLSYFRERRRHCSPGQMSTKWLLQTPVEPNPPLPRTVLSRSSTSVHSTSGIGTTANCATRSPRVNATVCAPWLMSRTVTSPR